MRTHDEYGRDYAGDHPNDENDVRLSHRAAPGHVGLTDQNFAKVSLVEVAMEGMPLYDAGRFEAAGNRSVTGVTRRAKELVRPASEYCRAIFMKFCHSGGANFRS